MQIERLLRAIYQPQNVYCIHVDSKSHPLFKEAIRKLSECLDNVFVASESENVQWGGISVALGDVHCMTDLLQHPVQWKYLINLCGQDFPLKTNREIVGRLKNYTGRNCIAGVPVHGGKFEFRTKYIYRFISVHDPPMMYDTPYRMKDPPPGNMTIYKGPVWIAATRGFVDYIINDELAKGFLTWLNDTLIPDETFTPSLGRVPQAPGYLASPHECYTHFKRLARYSEKPTRRLPRCRGKYWRDICIFTVADLQYLQDMPELFINKFHYDYDPVTMQCMEELLGKRRISP